MPIVNCIVPQIIVPQRAGVVTAINGRVATNLISNGNFANGTTGWVNGNGISVSASNNTLTLTATGSTAYPYAKSNSAKIVPTNSKWYISTLARITNSNCNSLICYAPYIGTQSPTIIGANIVNNPVQNQWYNFNLIEIFKDTDVGFAGVIVLMQHGYADTATANGKVMEVQNVLAIDLTATFGAGNEPTVDQCNALFQNWFDGSTVI
jgi:hypothetical protein